MRFPRLLLLTPIITTALLAQDPDTKAVAVRAERAPKIDGRDDDAVWKSARVYSEFREFQPHDNGPARFKTEFRIAYDDAAIYVFIRAFDPHPDSIMRALTRHDVRGPSDQLKVMLDPYLDRRSGFEFAVNPDGVKREFAMSQDQNEDPSWDGVWNVATTVDSLGWTAEFAIPFSQLRYADQTKHTFGIGIWRDIERFKERVSWPVYSNQKAGMVSQLGTVEGLDGIPSPRTFEATPYAVAKNLSRARAPAGFERAQNQTIGGDLKVGLSSNLTLNATVNPDFGQVEADPAVLNLSAFETFFPEKRPFFVEGAGLYQFSIDCSIVNCSNEGLFYSRRIGRSPQLSGSYGDATTATATPILAAAKLTGRSSGGFSLGVLDALTPRVGGTLARTMEPQTNYVVARAQQEIDGGASSVGAIATLVNRSLDDWTSPYLRSTAAVGGGDFQYRFHNKEYAWSGRFTMSEVTGSAQAIAATQRSAVHYFQQTDGHLGLDTTRTSLTGDSEELLFGKYGGGVTRFETSYIRQSPGYEANDLGYLRRADQQVWATWAALSYRNPTNWYKSAQFNFNNWNYWNAEGLLTQVGLNTNWHINFPNYTWLNLGASWNGITQVYCDRCTRGGPVMAQSGSVYPWFGFSGDDRNPLVPYLYFNFGSWDGGRSHFFDNNGELDIKASTNLSFSVNYDYNVNNDNTQWYGNFVDGGATHYSFAHLNQKTVSIGARATYTASPTLTFEFYGAPFVTTGTYDNVRQLSATPRASDYDARFSAYTAPAGTSTGFTYTQINTNTVVRWEYRPGSTMFVVWQHGRSGSQSDPQRRTIDDGFSDLFALHPDNTFLVKFAYWLSR